ncbi:MAG: THUMP domain-containing protein [Rhodocyclaceae bacterium]
MYQFFAICPRGLEALLAEELSGAGGDQLDVVAGGVGFAGDWRCCYRANLESRIATRILWRLARTSYRREEDIYRLAYDVPWHQHFSADATLRVDVTAIKSPLRSLDFITLRVKDAVCDRFRAECGRRPNVDTRAPDVRIQVFLTAEEVTLYIDTSGAPLYKRGFKRAAVEAPLKENLAAGILMLTSWAPDEPLLDTMCGSGTFLIEAAQMALGIAPGAGRSFGFQQLADFDESLWRNVLREAEERRRSPGRLEIYGSDLYGEQLKRARENLAAAGLAERVPLKQANILELTPPPGSSGVMIANPPYGARLGEKDALSALYPQIGDALKQRFAGWRCYFFSADKELPRLIGLRTSRRIPLFNGPLECRLYEYRMIQGTVKAEKPPRAEQE